MSSYISSLFSRDPAVSFNYEISDTLFDEPDRFLWTVSRGQKKGSGDPVTVFAVDVKQRSSAQIDLPKTTVKRLRTLRHPNIVTYLDSLETDKVIYLVTEKCIPLEVYLKDSKLKSTQKELACSWGLYQIANCIKFLCQEAKLVHNNINSMSIFVTPSGQWKLFGLEYVLTPEIEPIHRANRTESRSTAHRKLKAEMFPVPSPGAWTCGALRV